MSASGGARSRGGDDRFYCPPAMRKYYHEQEQQKRKSKLQKPLKPKSMPPSMISEKGLESDDCSSSTNAVVSVSNSSVSPPGISNLTNLDRFLEHTTPIVPAQYFSKTSMRQWRTSEDEFHPFFVLDDLWESFKEWSAYGAGVPLVLNGRDSVVQYYVPFLSGIQLYINPLKPFTSLRRPGEESDADSSRETSSDGGSECGAQRATNHAFGAVPQSFSNPPGLLLFEYFERDPPFSREPLADKIRVLASRFPQLKTCTSCELTPASWISVAWYPIYRIPTGPTLQNLDACFLTFHSLSTPFTIADSNTDSQHIHVPTARQLHSADVPLKLLLPIFGLASYKFKVSVWNPDGIHETQKVNSLLRAADNWLNLLRVNHPDYRFFMSHNL